MRETVDPRRATEAGTADTGRATGALTSTPRHTSLPPLRLALFVNDSYFAYLLARRLLEAHHDVVQKVILSSLVERMPRRVGRIWRQTTARYFLYRSFVQFVSIVRGRLRGESVRALARRLGIPVLQTADVGRDLEHLLPEDAFDLGLAFNFDQILKPAVLARFPLGVINLHASRLPADKGISPAVWAFSRGESIVWASLYKMDAGIDSGPLVRQFSVAIRPADSAFSLYARLCDQGARELEKFVAEVQSSRTVAARPQPDEKENYCSWPDSALELRRRALGRRLISSAQAVRLLLPCEYKVS